jgi:hypothetical protein
MAKKPAGFLDRVAMPPFLQPVPMEVQMFGRAFRGAVKYSCRFQSMEKRFGGLAELKVPGIPKDEGWEIVVEGLQESRCIVSADIKPASPD